MIVLIIIYCCYFCAETNHLGIGLCYLCFVQSSWSYWCA